MVLPLLPAFFAVNLGASTTLIGVMQGVAKSAGSLLQLFSGYWSQVTGKRKSLTFLGYFLSNVSKPLYFFAGNPIIAFFIRVADSAGKGFRTPPRDALLADSAPSGKTGLAFGFNRALDSAGAVLGPLIGFALLNFAGIDYQWIFLIAAVPSVLALWTLASGVTEIPGKIPGVRPKIFGTLPKGRFPLFLAAVFFLYAGVLPDLLALLRAQELGVSISTLPLYWVLYNMTGSFFAAPFGHAFDRKPKKVLIYGWLAYFIALLGFGHLSREFFPFLFMVFGVFDAATDGPLRAAVVRLVPTEDRAAAFGWYHGVRSAAFLLAGSFIGWGWQNFGISAAFTGAGLASLIGFILLLRVKLK
jgi:MFS family permease